MEEVLPLSESDRERLGRKADRARAALRTCAGFGLATPLAIAVLFGLTPTELSATTVVLASSLCLVLALPVLMKCLDLRRAVQRVDTWIERGHKHRLTGKVTRTGPYFVVTVGGLPVAAWEHSRKLAGGDVITVEYLPLDSDLAGIVGVLRVDGEPNPYLESAWRSGPPTA